MNARAHTHTHTHTHTTQRKGESWVMVWKQTKFEHVAQAKEDLKIIYFAKHVIVGLLFRTTCICPQRKRNCSWWRYNILVPLSCMSHRKKQTVSNRGTIFTWLPIPSSWKDPMQRGSVKIQELTNIFPHRGKQLLHVKKQLQGIKCMTAPKLPAESSKVILTL